jgi:hypothetical protein
MSLASFEIRPRETYVVTIPNVVCPHCEEPATAGTLMKTIHFQCLPRSTPNGQQMPPSRNTPGKCIVCNEILQPETPWTAVHWDCATEIMLGDFL